MEREKMDSRDQENANFVEEQTSQICFRHIQPSV